MVTMRANLHSPGYHRRLAPNSEPEKTPERKSFTLSRYSAVVDYSVKVEEVSYWSNVPDFHLAIRFGLSVGERRFCTVIASPSFGWERSAAFFVVTDQSPS
jgi:hypothetical protein